MRRERLPDCFDVAAALLSPEVRTGVSAVRMIFGEGAVRVTTSSDATGHAYIMFKNPLSGSL